MYGGVQKHFSCDLVTVLYTNILCLLMNSWKVQKGVMMQETNKKHEWLTFYHTPTLLLGRRERGQAYNVQHIHYTQCLYTPTSVDTLL